MVNRLFGYLIRILDEKSKKFHCLERESIGYAALTVCKIRKTSVSCTEDYTIRSLLYFRKKLILYLLSEQKTVGFDMKLLSASSFLTKRFQTSISFISTSHFGSSEVISKVEINKFKLSTSDLVISSQVCAMAA